MNSEFGTCTCPIGISGAPYKHQGAVTMKYHIAILNFILSLMPEDRIVYAYVALGKLYYIKIVINYILTHISLFLGYVFKDDSFYASLRAQPTSHNQELILSALNNNFSNNIFDETIEWR
jgi:hypothetical protein